MSIFDVNKINSKVVDNNTLKTFVKYCGCDKSKHRFEVEAGAFYEELYDDYAVAYFKLNNLFKAPKWEINTNGDNQQEVQLIFEGWESCDAFLESLEFMIGILKEAKDRVRFRFRNVEEATTMSNH